MRVGISRNWGHHPRPPDWQQWTSRPLLQQCAHHWDYLNSVGYRQVKHLVEIMRFEDMIADPLGFATGVCDIVGLRPEDCMEDLQSWALRVQDKNNEQFLEAKTSRPYSTNDHRVKVGRWKENLTSEEVDMIRPMVEEVAITLGYELDV
ncbi:MAG: sulfotransferase domain-containing protein [Cyclobacteriaceae bacterium]|nr:sulfotransferase domain-containing protein [Cyclobacteriaceae bacterium]